MHTYADNEYVISFSEQNSSVFTDQEITGKNFNLDSKKYEKIMYCSLPYTIGKYNKTNTFRDNINAVGKHLLVSFQKGIGTKNFSHSFYR